MNNSKTVIIILSLCIFSCKKENKYDNPEKLCQIIKKIHNDDQKYRQLMIDPFFDILDSIKKSEGISKKEYSGFSEEKQLAYGRIARAITNKRELKFTKQQEDSLMQLQIVLDNKNTELLIDIIKKRGFPNLPDCKEEQFPAITLRHSQNQYWDEIRILIEKEFKLGNMNKGQFKIILNHINGREEFSITKEKFSNLELK